MRKQELDGKKKKRKSSKRRGVSSFCREQTFDAFDRIAVIRFRASSCGVEERS